MNWLKKWIRIKEFYPKFGLGLVLYSDAEERDGNLLMLHFIFGRFYIALPRILKARVERVKAFTWDAATIARLGRDWYEKKTERMYGFTFSEECLHVYYGIQPGSWDRNDPKNSDHTKLFRLPWNDWEMVRHDILNRDGTLALRKPKKFEYVEIRKTMPEICTTSTYDYAPCSQSVLATIYGEEREWRLRWAQWFPWIRIVRRQIDIEFSEEVGSRRGSWKGGCLGCSWDWHQGETQLQALRRMEREREFR